MRDFLLDYLDRRPEAVSCLSGMPADLLGVPPATAPWAPGLAGVVLSYQEAVGNTCALKGDERVIATGQQCGLMTGPLYTIYKAATAIRLSEQMTRHFGARCIPVFWIASVDHDFAEVCTTHLLGKSHDLVSLTYEPDAPVDGLPMYRVPVETGLHSLVDQAVQSARGSEFRDDVAAFLHESLDASESLSDWFARILSRLFRDTPLVLFAPHLPEARALAAPVLEWEIAHPLVLTRLLNEAGDRLKAMGYRPQIVKEATECNFFLEVDQHRRKVRFEKGHFIVPDASLTFTVDEMLGLLRAAPERFTSNVALRCLEQQHLFAPAAYVAGPGEVAYWAQLKPLFDAVGLPMPIVYPRARAVFTSLKVNALLSQFGLTVSDMTLPKPDLLARVLKATAQDPAFAIAQRHRQRIDASFDDFVKELGAVDQAAANMAQRVRTSTVAGLERLEGTLVRAQQGRVDTVARQLERLQTELMPIAKPQERVINIFSYLFEHGWDLVSRIVREIDVADFSLKEIEL